MKKLLEFLALNQTDGDFGVEIEVEGENLPAVFTDGWKTEIDNSLRGGQEYIFAGPCNLEEVETRLLYLHKMFKYNEAKPKFSFRTSVHVHLNVQDLTYNQLLNAIYTYLLIEEPLMNLCGEERKGNRFCLRLADAEGMMETLSKMFSGGELFINKIQNNKMRYAAINVEALGKYGSLEFRAMKGNMDTDKIVMWCNSLLNIREFAKKFSGPTEIYNLYIAEDAGKFFNTVLGDCAKHFEYPELVHDIQRNFSLSIDLPFAFARKKETKKEDLREPEEAPKIRAELGVDDIELTVAQKDQCAIRAHRNMETITTLRRDRGQRALTAGEFNSALLKEYGRVAAAMKDKVRMERRIKVKPLKPARIIFDDVVEMGVDFPNEAV